MMKGSGHSMRNDEFLFDNRIEAFSMDAVHQEKWIGKADLVLYYHDALENLPISCYPGWRAAFISVMPCVTFSMIYCVHKPQPDSPQGQRRFWST